MISTSQQETSVQEQQSLARGGEKSIVQVRDIDVRPLHLDELMLVASGPGIENNNQR